MDKVQFNTQVVNMRKTVKRAKVQLIHRLTRQISVMRKKKGTENQVLKNERRAGRLVEEIEAVKDFPCDEVTMSAIINKEPLDAVLSKVSSTTAERAMARLVNQKLISQQVASFRDLVTPDLLEIGKKKEKSLNMERDETPVRRRSSCSSDDIEVEEDDGSSDDDLEGQKRVMIDEKSDSEESDDQATLTMKQAQGKTNSKSLTLSEQNQQIREQMKARHKKKSGFFMTGDEEDDDSKVEENYEEEEEDSGDEDAGCIEDLYDDIDDTGEDFSAEFRELSSQFRKERGGVGGEGGVEKEQRKHKGLDSLFVGKLSGKTPHYSSSGVDRSRKNRPGQKERQRINIKKQLEILRRPSNKSDKAGSKHVVKVDLPSLNSGGMQPGRKVIPGINAPFEKPITDPSNQKLLPSQRPTYTSSKQGRGREERGPGTGRGNKRGGAALPLASETLHPSWEAKKKKKQEESKILPYAGKKITFDD